MVNLVQLIKLYSAVQINTGTFKVAVRINTRGRGGGDITAADNPVFGDTAQLEQF